MTKKTSNSPISRAIERCKLAIGSDSNAEMIGELTMAGESIKVALRAAKESAAAETNGQQRLKPGEPVQTELPGAEVKVDKDGVVISEPAETFSWDSLQCDTCGVVTRDVDGRPSGDICGVPVEDGGTCLGRMEGQKDGMFVDAPEKEAVPA